MARRQVNQVPGFFKIVGERGLPQGESGCKASACRTEIVLLDQRRVNGPIIDARAGIISVSHNSRSIPIEDHSKGKIFGHLRSSSNYDDNELCASSLQRLPTRTLSKRTKGGVDRQ